jgi:thiamine biosynthesis lipoprotein
MTAITTASTWTGSAWSCTVRLVVGDPRALTPATADLRALLERVDAAVSRFRPDSALSIANARAGRPTPVPALLVDLVAAALDAARASAGAVDPTLGRALQRLGYDRDIAAIAPDDPASLPAAPAPGRWRAVRLHRAAGLLTVPAGTGLDLGATAKAWTADTAARTLAARYDTGVLVELGGDLAVAGARSGGWCVRVAERSGGDGELVVLRDGGITTSTTTVRTWRRGGRHLHHLLDPATGEPVAGPWRTVTVAAGSALAANTASTAAIVRGEHAVADLTGRGLAARLVGTDGRIVRTPGWPRARRNAA